MLPTWWTFLILALAAYRWTRLAGWDDFPPIERLRNYVLGYYVSKQYGPRYRRPTFAHLVHCPFCIGWWISAATYTLWLLWPDMLYGAVPFALSGAVGLIAKNLDG